MNKTIEFLEFVSERIIKFATSDTDIYNIANERCDHQRKLLAALVQILFVSDSSDKNGESVGFQLREWVCLCQHDGVHESLGIRIKQ